MSVNEILLYRNEKHGMIIYNIFKIPVNAYQQYGKVSDTKL